MKKYINLLFLAVSFFLSSLEGTEVLLEFEGAYYGPTGHLFRRDFAETYQAGIETSVQAWRGLYPFVSGSLSTKWGNTALGNKTRVKFIPIGVGLKYLWKFNFGDVYLGAGALPTHVNLFNDSPYVTQHVSKWGCGAVGKAGFLFDLASSFFLDLFGAYSYIRIPYHNSRGGTVVPTTIDLSGYSLGIGLGYRFNSDSCPRVCERDTGSKKEDKSWKWNKIRCPWK